MTAMEPRRRPRVLVAGIGNIFLGDDGFGVEVVGRLARREVPDWVRVADFGIRGIHLAYELLDHQYETTILVDAMPLGQAPGTVAVVEPVLADEVEDDCVTTDAHGMSPDAVFQLLRSLGGTPGRVLIVGCEPGSVEEQMGLSPPVAAAVDEAVSLVLDLLARLQAERPPQAGEGEDRRVSGHSG